MYKEYLIVYDTEFLGTEDTFAMSSAKVLAQAKSRDALSVFKYTDDDYNGHYIYLRDMEVERV